MIVNNIMLTVLLKKRREEFSFNNLTNENTPDMLIKRILRLFIFKSIFVTLTLIEPNFIEMLISFG
jgi:hypothetical protein